MPYLKKIIKITGISWMKKLKKRILDVLLFLIFRKKIYVHPFVQSCVKLQLIIQFEGNYILIKDQDRIKIPSVEVNLEAKTSFLATIKDYLSSNISKRISNSTFLNLYLMEFCREMIETKDEAKLFVDDLYLKIDLNDHITKEELLENAVVCSLQDIKLLQFKNKFNILDYKVVVKSQTDEGLLIK